MTSKPQSGTQKAKKTLKIIPKKTIDQTEFLGGLEFYKRQELIWGLECPAPEKLILLSLNQHADSNGECFPGLKRIQKKCGLTRADRIIDRLITKGLITNYSRFDNEGRMKSNGYQILFKSLKDANDNKSKQDDTVSMGGRHSVVGEDDTVSMGGRHCVVGEDDTVSMGGRHSVVGEDDTVSSELDHSESIQLTNPNELEQLTPEREKNHELSSSRTIGLSIAEDFGGRSDFVVQQPKDSPLTQDDRREDQIAAAPKISPEPPKRVENALDRQLMRQGIDPELWMRWRAKYEPFVEQVSSTGFGSDSAAQTSWANLVRQGWTPDADFWAGLDAEIEDGTAKYIAGGCIPVFGLCGGSAWLRDRRWERANRRRQVNQSFTENGIGRVEVVHKDVARSEAKRKQDAAVEAVRKKIELKQQLALEQSDDF